MLENTRFDPGETKNDPAFARELADGCDLYVNDAFGSAHRAHASTEASRSCCPPTRACCSLDELEQLGRLLGEVERPFVLVTGGAKVEDKLGVLEHLGGRADAVLVGGKMAEELRDENPLSFPVVLPIGRRRRGRVRGGRGDAGRRRTTPLPDGWLGLDIGPETRARSREQIARRPDDLLERPDGRVRVAALRRGHEGGREAVADAEAYSVVGGGDSVRADQRARPRRPHLVGLDRRRRVARAARGQGAARRRSDPGGLTCNAKCS